MKNEQRSKSFNLEVGIGCKSQIVLKSGWSVLNWASKGKKKEAKSLSKAETNEVHWFVDLYQGYLLWPIYPIEPSMAIELQFWEATKIPRPFCNHCSPQSRKPISPSYASNSELLQLHCIRDQSVFGQRNILFSIDIKSYSNRNAYQICYKFLFKMLLTKNCY